MAAAKPPADVMHDDDNGCYYKDEGEPQNIWSLSLILK